MVEMMCSEVEISYAPFLCHALVYSGYHPTILHWSFVLSKSKAESSRCLTTTQRNTRSNRISIYTCFVQTLMARSIPSPTTCLSPRKATGLRHGSVLLLEPVAQPLRSLHVLIDAAHHAALFPRSERFALEAVDAAVETLLDEVGVHLMPDPSAVSPSNATGPGAPRRLAWRQEMRNAYVHEFFHLLLLHTVLQLALL